MCKNNKLSLEVAEIKNVNNWTSVLVHKTFEELSSTDAKGALRKFKTVAKSELNYFYFLGFPFF
jgi:nitroimidazol reductase NimA-like FMN-containing flavoprotein (pyridoxamine 5'-phosphate oxidase superfamily)